MSMVTLHHVISNYDLPLETKVKVCRAKSEGDVIDMYPLLDECEFKTFLDEHTGDIISLEELIKTQPELAKTFEWAISADHKVITHFEFGLIQLFNELFIGKYVLLEIQP